MIRHTVISAAALAIAALAMTNPAHAFFGNMMDPSEWFGNDDDDYYRRYGYGPYGGWGGGPYGGGYGYGRPSTIVVNPSEGSKQSAPRTPE